MCFLGVHSLRFLNLIGPFWHVSETLTNVVWSTCRVYVYGFMSGSTFGVFVPVRSMVTHLCGFNCCSVVKCHVYDITVSSTSKNWVSIFSQLVLLEFVALLLISWTSWGGQILGCQEVHWKFSTFYKLLSSFLSVF